MKEFSGSLAETFSFCQFCFCIWFFYHFVLQINEIIKLCTEDFEWYLELCPGYYKAAYYLIKINLNKDYNKCRGLLLQLPRKNNEQEKRLSLFDIHRCRSLFKVCALFYNVIYLNITSV